MSNYSNDNKTCFALDNSLYLRSYYDTFSQLKNLDKTIETIFSEYVEKQLLASTFSSYTKLSKSQASSLLTASLLPPDEKQMERALP